MVMSGDLPPKLLFHDNPEMRLKIAETLIENKADVNAADKEGTVRTWRVPWMLRRDRAGAGPLRGAVGRIRN
jgi:hypothetical protein